MSKPRLPYYFLQTFTIVFLIYPIRWYRHLLFFMLPQCSKGVSVSGIGEVRRKPGSEGSDSTLSLLEGLWTHGSDLIGWAISEIRVNNIFIFPSMIYRIFFFIIKIHLSFLSATIPIAMLSQTCRDKESRLVVCDSSAGSSALLFFYNFI